MSDLSYNGKRVLSMGAVAMDVVLASSGLPRDDGFSLVADEMLVPGGSAANMSVALHNLGAQVAQCGKIGDDHYGVTFRADLVAHDVDVTPLVVKPGGTTLHTYIITAPGGEHCIFANTGDCVMQLARDELPESVMQDFDLFYNDMFSADTALALAKEARAAGKPVVYNMQTVPSFMETCGVPREKIEDMMRTTCLAIGGTAGFRELVECEDTPEAVAKAAYEKYRPEEGVICTCGSRGSVWYGPEGLHRGEAFHVETVDSTGAGDTFCAGLIFARYCCGAVQEEALRFAAAVAALKCTVPGPRSVAALADVNAFMRKGEQA